MANAVRRKGRSKPTPKPTLPEGSIALTPEDVEVAKIQLLLMMHHRNILRDLEQELVNKLETSYGANVGPGGGYALNVADGRLDRTES